LYDLPVGFLKRRPGPGDTVRFQSKDSSWGFYGIMVSAKAVAHVGQDGNVEESDVTLLGYAGRVDKVPDNEAAPRRDVRKIIRHMGATPVEEMIGPASEDELDRRWELMQELRNHRDDQDLRRLLGSGDVVHGIEDDDGHALAETAVPASCSGASTAAPRVRS
jgi:hypothetical protein